MTSGLDDLTGLFSREMFLPRLAGMISESLQTRQYLTLLILDIDDLTGFNKAHGHVAGDQLISAVAGRLHTAFAEHGLLGRYGGDEFIAALLHPQPGTVLELAEELVESLQIEGVLPGTDPHAETIPCPVSIGLAICPGDAAEINELIDKAKQALFRAKKAGGRKVCLYEAKDLLTGLLNPYGIQLKLDEILQSSNPRRDQFALICIDIDGFDRINQRFGHLAGDRIIKRLAEILNANFKDNGVIGRFGGDEYLIILPGSRPDTGFILTEEIRRLVEVTDIQLPDNEESPLHFTISAGIASYPADGSERVDLLRKAEEALYNAKLSGRNRVFLPSNTQMITKTSHYTQTQLERLAKMAREVDKSEAALLREALDDLLRRFDEQRH